MSEAEILSLCKEPIKKKTIYWTAEVYGFGPVIRKYGFYPKSLPLNIYFSHGVTHSEIPAPHELMNNAPFVLYFSPRLVKAFKKVSPKSCYCLLSPNVFYRKLNSIRQDRNAKGTLAFLGHTSKGIDDKMDFAQYARQLKELPEAYHPISICFHYHDVNKGIYKIFMNEGFNILTVGHPYHPDFIKRFYDIIKSFKYLTSNEIGSYAYYGTEAGIPFFIYGDEPKFYNYGDRNLEFGKYSSYKRTDRYQEVRKLFLHPIDKVTPDQKSVVEKELGVYDTISRFHLSLILYKAYWQYVYPKLKRKIYRNLRIKEIKALKMKFRL
jgi:hypothetical protein